MSALPLATFLAPLEEEAVEAAAAAGGEAVLPLPLAPLFPAGGVGVVPPVVLFLLFLPTGFRFSFLAGAFCGGRGPSSL